MDALVLDTNIVSYLWRGDPIAEPYRPHLVGKTQAISFMTIGEMFEGAYRRNWSEPKILRLRDFLKFFLIIPYSPRLLEIHGRVRADRRREPIPVDDALIAASALVHDCPLVTHNPRDFIGISGLRLITETFNR